MKFIILTILAISWTSFANATEYKLTPPTGSLISLNKCLYALSKGTKLSSSSDNTYLYKNELWLVSYLEGKKVIQCELAGMFSE